MTRKVNGREVQLDNRWVVPYNPYLSRKYSAHINVEICASVKAIKYIHKYVYKGTDQATVHISTADQLDEVGTHLQCRYVSPAEAVVRLFEFHTHEEYPPVVRLPVHLEGEQPVFFRADATAEEVEAAAERRQTELMGFFAYNAAHSSSRNLLYIDFPTHHVWDKEKREWKPRKRGTCIGRMQYVPPTAGERYFLRVLLCNIPGPQSFQHLRTVGGTTYPTFRAACIAAGLLDSDQRWIDCFQEACVWQSGKALRHLFAICLLTGDVADPLALWSQFKESLCDDLPWRIARLTDIPPGLADPHFDYGLHLLNELFAEFGKTLQDFGLPPCQYEWQSTYGNPLLQNELSYNLEEQHTLFTDIRSKLNQGQAALFEEITSHIDSNPQTAHYFIQGPGGTGKTFLYRCLSSFYRSSRHVVLCVASSGIAALLLDGGRTSHSRFKIPVEDISDSSVCSIRKNTQLARLLQQTKLIIWDEVPMQHRFCFEAVDRTLRDICNCDTLFGGIPTILGGDFAQILPVVRKGNRSQIVQACLQSSSIWPQLQVRKLMENMRVQGADPDNRAFIQWLQDLSYNSAFHSFVEPLPHFSLCFSPEELVQRVYPPDLLAIAATSPSVFAERAILCPRNTAVTEFNSSILSSFPGESRRYYSSNTVDNPPEEGDLNAPVLSPEFLFSLDFASIPPPVLDLKVGVPVILLRNLHPQEGLCNGTRLVITRLGRSVVEARILSGSFAGQLRIIPRIKLSSSPQDFPYIISRVQFPLRLCFAMSINKAQGQSFTYIGVDLREPVFSHGQFYVAMSRVTDVHNISICLSGRKEDGCKLANIVYPEVLIQ